MTDERQLKMWMIMALEGDANAQLAMLRAMVPILDAFFRQRLRNEAHVIETLVQDTLISVHMKRATYDRDQPLTPWMYAIARYRMNEYFGRVGLSGQVDDIKGQCPFGELGGMVVDEEKTSNRSGLRR